MAKKKHWMQKKSNRENIAIALWVVLFLLIIEALRFCIESFIESDITWKSLGVFFIPWVVALVFVIVYLREIEKSIKNN